MKLGRFFAGRLPGRRNILGVYAVIVLLVYSWTLFTSFYKLPSWMFRLTIGQILSVYAYAFSVDLLESILVLAAVLFLDLTLFLALRNMEEFQSRSVLLVLGVLVVAGSRLILFPGYEDIDAFLQSESISWGISLPLLFLLSVVGSKIGWVRKGIELVAERASIFLYIYIPLGLISLLVVFIRNLY